MTDNTTTVHLTEDEAETIVTGLTAASLIVTILVHTDRANHLFDDDQAALIRKGGRLLVDACDTFTKAVLR